MPDVPSTPMLLSEILKTGLLLPQRHATCPTCGGAFVQLQQEHVWAPLQCRACDGHAATEAAEAQREASDAERRVAALDVPPYFGDASLDRFATTHNPNLPAKLALARRYVCAWPERTSSLAFPRLVLLLGRPGTGKTHLAWAIAKDIVRLHGGAVKVTKLEDMIGAMRRSWNEHGPWTPERESEEQVKARFRSYDLLVIDEVSEHAFAGAPIQPLTSILVAREEYLRPTILITNDTPAVFGALVGDALMSRLADGQQGVWEFGAEPHLDYRAARTHEPPAKRLRVSR